MRGGGVWVWIMILSRYKFHLIRKHDNLVYDPSDKKSIVFDETGETHLLIEIEIFVKFLKRKMFLCTSLN